MHTKTAKSGFTTGIVILHSLLRLRKLFLVLCSTHLLQGKALEVIASLKISTQKKDILGVVSLHQVMMLCIAKQCNLA